MEISYRREMKHNYLVIEGEQQAESYEVRMLAGNVIDGLMRFRLKRVDDRSCYCYEITSKQPLSRLLENKSIRAEEVRSLILGMSKTLNKMEEYLLKEEQILLKPDYIYVEPELFTTEFCLIPGREGDFPGELCKLLEYLLGKVDYQDKECVVMIYGMYRESLKENYGMEDLLKYLVHKEQGFVSLQNPKEPESNGAQVHIPEHPPVPRMKQDYPKFPDGNKKQSWLARIREKINRLFRGYGKKGAVEFNLSDTAPQSGKETEFPWKMVFAEEETGTEESKEIPPPDDVNQTRTYQVPEGPNTVLLSDKEEKKFHTLISLEKGIPDIRITYTPFIIGKQESLVDYVLDYGTVSRLHLRLDEEDGICRITDLNSTNGTEIAGKMLENNESVQVNPGDEVTVAGLKYRFM